MIRIEFLLAYVRSRAMDMMTTMQSMCSSLGLGAIGVLANLYVLSLVSRGRRVSGDRALRGHRHDVRRGALRKVALALQGGGAEHPKRLTRRTPSTAGHV